MRKRKQKIEILRLKNNLLKTSFETRAKKIWKSCQYLSANCLGKICPKTVWKSSKWNFFEVTFFLKETFGHLENNIDTNPKKTPKVREFLIALGRKIHKRICFQMVAPDTWKLVWTIVTEFFRRMSQNVQYFFSKKQILPEAFFWIRTMKCRQTFWIFSLKTFKVFRWKLEIKYESEKDFFENVFFRKLLWTFKA